MSLLPDAQTSPSRMESPLAWVFFGDLMAGLLGLFALLFVWAMVFQLDLAESLRREQDLRGAEQARREALEQALARPLAEGRITLEEGRIGILGQLLFELNSADLQPGAEALIEEVAGPLARYLEGDAEMLIMVSGFTDDLPYLSMQRRYRDNWELSSERALTVARSLLDMGLPSERVFAAAFGPEHPAVPNSCDDNRARNRRVEIAPVPRRVHTKNVATAAVVTPELRQVESQP
ncbi:MAG: OmpA family protein [Pseudomonadota bacterium]